MCFVSTGGPGPAGQEVRDGGEHQDGADEADPLSPAGPDQDPPEAAGHLHHVPVREPTTEKVGYRIAK